MWIVSIYLIEATAQHKELTYFSAHEHEPGEIVKLPARGRESYGLVTKCESVTDVRQTVRNAGFSLQKIMGAGRRFLTHEFLHAAFEIAALSGTSAGSVLSALVATAMIEKIDVLTSAPEPSSATETAPKPAYRIGSRGERIDAYRTLVSDTLQVRKSILIIAPTIMEAERIAAQTETLAFHSGLSKKKMQEIWQRIAASHVPVAVCATPLGLTLPRNDWGVVVLERSLARGYERSSRPYLDVVLAANKCAEAFGAELIIGSPTMPVSEAADAEIPQNKPSLARVALVDMRPPKQPSDSVRLATKPKFELFSPAALGRITEALANGNQVLLVTARKGLAPHTSCDDCGTPLSCPRCGSGLVLHEKNQTRNLSLVEAKVQRWFECHYCGLTENVKVLCPVCGSWRLSMHGVGLTLVAREAAKHFPHAKLLVADDYLAGDASKAKKLAEQFRATDGAILAATESMLAYLAAPVELAVVVSVDSMLYVPEYSAPERALAFLSELAGMTERELIIQTRVPENPVVAALVSGDYAKYYENELSLREKFRYPPFWTLIRLSVSGTAEREKAQAEAIMAALEPFKPLKYSGHSVRRSMVREHILVRVMRENWPDPKLIAFLRSLPPSVEIRVNPKNVISD